MQYNTRVFNLFKRTTQSYKFLWGLALLELANDDSVISNKIRLDDILAYAAVYASNLATKYKVRLSCNSDSIFEKNILEAHSKTKDYKIKFTQIYSKDSREIIKKDFLKYVPYRFQSSFFDIKGNDSQKQRHYVDSIDSNNNRYSDILIYQIDYDNESLILNPNWREYLRKNYLLLKAYITQEFAKYLAKYNVDVPNLMLKVDPVADKNRENLTKQRIIWNDFIKDNLNIYDIYDGSILTSLNQGIDLDHYVPWNYVAHNMIWNLTPIKSSLNSQKSDRILIDDRYLSKLANQQYQLYDWVKSNNKTKVIEDYTIVSLNNLAKDSFINSYKIMIGSLCQSAIRQGFSEWKI
ncbi:HNH endonuclease domain-containing protein [Francisella sp. LA112445]|uniref:HNH endonuclease domain-containing protein n=1 Tax=Francisella sp. LA112445 TaxID=1395624 RepID=UPI001788CC35|nr:HNH endonuclease domain-containing protein [Francisella sp. LA112445]QIW10590.1 hypothetical protein FIP56_07700 [Francisella sp. LA112445]